VTHVQASWTEQERGEHPARSRSCSSSTTVQKRHLRPRAQGAHVHQSRHQV